MGFVTYYGRISGEAAFATHSPYYIEGFLFVCLFVFIIQLPLCHLSSCIHSLIYVPVANPNKPGGSLR